MFHIFIILFGFYSSSFHLSPGLNIPQHAQNRGHQSEREQHHDAGRLRLLSQPHWTLRQKELHRRDGRDLVPEETDKSQGAVAGGQPVCDGDKVQVHCAEDAAPFD